MKELPDGLPAYNKTQTYTDKTTPGMMKNDHQTRIGVWGKIIVLKGQVNYLIPADNEEIMLEPGLDGIIEPTTLHKVDPQPGSKFYIEFHRK